MRGPNSRRELNSDNSHLPRLPDESLNARAQTFVDLKNGCVSRPSFFGGVPMPSTSTSMAQRQEPSICHSLQARGRFEHDSLMVLAGGRTEEPDLAAGLLLHVVPDPCP